MHSTVILPTYNEAASIEAVVTRILSLNAGCEVIIVDDSSADGTGAIADQLAVRHKEVRVIHRLRKMGLGSAYIEGFRHALRNNADVVFEMDADLSHDPAYIPEFLRAIRSQDLVLGSRYLQGVSVVNWPIRRLILSKGATFYARAITGLPLTDATSGFKCIRRSVLEALDLDRILSQGYAFQIELNYKAYKKGFRLSEIPIVFVDRSQGASKLSRKEVLEAMWVVWKLRFSV